MKWIAATALLVFAGQAVAAPPQRIMSLKICTDELLLDLVPPSRIASVTFLSRETASLKVWPQGAAVPVNHGTAEEILSTKPDLILTDPYMAPALRPILAKSGAKVLEVPPAENFAQIRAVVRQVAASCSRARRRVAGCRWRSARCKPSSASRRPRPSAFAAAAIPKQPSGWRDGNAGTDWLPPHLQDLLPSVPLLARARGHLRMLQGQGARQVMANITEDETLLLLTLLSYGGAASTTHLREALCLSSSRIWHLALGLEEHGAVIHPRYGRYSLTEKGRIACALVMHKRPDLAVTFFDGVELAA
jgi:biotin operon repressor